MSDSGEPSDDQRDVRVRRAPKIGRFMIVGGGVGAIVTFILTASFPVDPAVGFGALFGYFALFGVTGGVVLGAILALLLDRRATKRATAATAALETVEPAVDEVEGELEGPGSADKA